MYLNFCDIMCSELNHRKVSFSDGFFNIIEANSHHTSMAAVSPRFRRHLCMIIAYSGKKPLCACPFVGEGEGRGTNGPESAKKKIIPHKNIFRIFHFRKQNNNFLHPFFTHMKYFWMCLLCKVRIKYWVVLLFRSDSYRGKKLINSPTAAEYAIACGSDQTIYVICSFSSEKWINKRRMLSFWRGKSLSLV